MRFIKVISLSTFLVAALLWITHALLATETLTMDEKARASAPGNFIQLSGGTTHYQLKGQAQGEVIVLVPGATLPMWVWNGLDKRLAAAGYYVLTYDMFGRGYSDRPDAVYDIDFHYQQLRELIDKTVPNRKVHLVNLALGALFSSEYVIRHPDKVSSLITIGPDGFGVKKKLSTRVLLSLPATVRDYLFHTVGSKILMSRLDTYSRDENVITRLKALYRPTLNYAGFKRAVLSSVLHMPINNARSLYKKVDESGVPVLFVWGRDDFITPFPGEAVVKDYLPRAQIKMLNNAGHLPQFEDVALVQTLIKDFISASGQ